MKSVYRQSLRRISLDMDMYINLIYIYIYIYIDNAIKIIRTTTTLITSYILISRVPNVTCVLLTRDIVRLSVIYVT